MGIRSTWLRVATAISVFLSLNGVVEAAGPVCFHPAEIEAEQAILFQTRLMVLSDICGGESYRTFTVRNREVIVSYQHQMIDHFRRVGGGKPETVFDRYLTRLANETSLSSGSQPIGALCASSGGELIATANKLDKEGFRHMAAAEALKEKAKYRHCKE